MKAKLVGIILTVIMSFTALTAIGVNWRTQNENAALRAENHALVQHPQIKLVTTPTTQAVKAVAAKVEKMPTKIPVKKTTTTATTSPATAPTSQPTSPVTAPPRGPQEPPATAPCIAGSIAQLTGSEGLVPCVR